MSKKNDLYYQSILCECRYIWTITSNRMTVPITSINYIKYPSIKSLFDKSGPKKIQFSHTYHMLYFHFKSCILRKKDIFYIIGLFSCECCYYMCNNSNTKSYDKWKSWVKTIKYCFNWNIFLSTKNNNTFLTKRNDFISLGQFHHSMWVS